MQRQRFLPGAVRTRGLGILRKVSLEVCELEEDEHTVLARQNRDVVEGWDEFGKLFCLCFLQYDKHSYSIDHFTLHYLEYNNAVSFTIMLSVPNNSKFQIKSYV